MDSILTSIKKFLGITKEDEDFDADIIMHINSVFLNLTEIGVGPSEGFRITDDSEIWSDFLSDNVLLEAAKSYVYLNVKLLFDPPPSSAHIESINRQIEKYEWRLNVAAESK